MVNAVTEQPTSTKVAGEPKAHIEQIISKGSDGENACVALVIEYGGKEATIRLQVDVSEIERAAMPKVIEGELHALMDALETIAEETNISFRG
jgi:hypothetical protein